MKLLYFTFEDINSSLFKNQVLDLMLSRKDRDSLVDITILIINKPSNFFKGLEETKKIRKKIKIIYLPVSPPMRYFTSSIFINKLYIYILKTIIKYIINVSIYDIIHCRHYLPSLIMMEIGAKNILFDVRSLSLFEYVAAGKIKENSDIFKYWLNQEKILSNYVAGISVVSKSMINYFSQYTNKEVSYCPIIVNTEKLKFSNASRQKFRYKWNWQEYNIYVYSGSFGLYGVNKKSIAQLINIIQNGDKKARFLFLLSNSKKELIEFIANFNLNKINYLYFSVAPDDLFSYLSASDVGIHALPQQLDSFTRLGTKIVEYWVIGLPTYISSSIGEAAEFSKIYDFGHVIDLENSEKNELLPNFEKFKFINNSSKANNLFSIKTVIKKYDNAYAKIMNKKIL